MQISRFWPTSDKKRVRALVAYSAIAVAVVISATISPLENGLALALGLGAFAGLAAVGSILPFHMIAKAALVSAVWAFIYGLKAAGAPLLEIPVYLSIVGLGFAITHRHGYIPGFRRSNLLSRINAHWEMWRSHLKTTALLTLAFSALSASIFWVLEGAGIDNVLPIVVTIGLAMLGTKYVNGHRSSNERVARPLSFTTTSASSIFWTFLAATMLFSVVVLMLFGSHHGVVKAMESTLSLEEPIRFNALEHSGQDEHQTHGDGGASPIESLALEAFTSHPWKEDCILDETGVRYCDPVNLVFVSQTLDDVKLSLLSAGWITSTRRGSDQYLRWESQDYHRHDLQLHFYESLRARYHVRLWESPDQTIVVGAVHHEEGVIHHTIDIDWDQAQQFVEKQLCSGRCGMSGVLSDHPLVQGDTKFWRGMTNDGRISIISATE